MTRRDEPRARPAALRALEGALWLAVAALFLWRVTPQLRAAIGSDARGPAAPAVTFDMLGGGALPLDALKGQVVLVNFWATWCPPCRAEMPGLEAVYEAKRAEGFTIVGVSMDEASRAKVEAFLRARGIRYPVAMGSDEAAAAFGGIASYPTSFLIDRRGRVRYTVEGMFAEPTLRAAVNGLLAEGR